MKLSSSNDFEKNPSTNNNLTLSTGGGERINLMMDFPEDDDSQVFIYLFITVVLINIS